MSNKSLEELLSINLEDRTLEELIEYLKELTAELGNGTLSKVKEDKEKCKDLAKQAGELHDILGE